MFELMQGLFAGIAQSGGARRCLVVEASGDVIDQVMIDPSLPPEQQWQPPAGTLLVESEVGGIGWRYVGGVLSDPRPPPPEPERGAPDVD